ncbi:MAG: TQO small subunit DoxD [Candidatus Sumerlaeia bacterium]
MQQMRSISSANLYVPHGEVAARIWLLLPLRLYAGFFLIFEALRKVGMQMLSEPERWVESLRPIIEAPDYSYGFYRGIFNSVIEPSAGAVVFLLVLGELLIGAMIVVGALTRVMAFFGMVVAINIYFAHNYHFWDTSHNMTALILILLTLMLTGAGRAYGIDHLLRGKMPGWIC